MKYSFYNVIRPYRNDFVLYNAFSENHIFISTELYNLFFNGDISIREIEEKHPSLYRDLCNRGFLVESDVDEPKEFIEKFISEGDVDTCSNYNLIINPTLDCNLRCWYCYESHKKESEISENVMKGINAYVQSLIRKQNIKLFTLSFFGGEPLMKFRKIILPLIKRTSDLCHDNEVSFNVHFTTNAVLLTPTVIDCMCDANIDFSVQVPFDGNEYYHNKTKGSNLKLGSYRRTIDNVLYGISKGIVFVIRCNCTLDNIDSFKELVDEFAEISDKSCIVFSIQIVWQETITQNLRQKEKELYKYIFDKGFNKLSSSIPPAKCYADNSNIMMVAFTNVLQMIFRLIIEKELLKKMERFFTTISIKNDAILCIIYHAVLGVNCFLYVMCVHNIN